MTLRIPDLGTGNGSTGDNELKIRQDYNHNFSEPSHAASRIVGTATDQVPLASQAYKATFSVATDLSKLNDTAFDCNNCDTGVKYLLKSTHDNTPPLDGQYLVTTEFGYLSEKLQTAVNKTDGSLWIRAQAATWTAWKPSTNNLATYITTTASGANVVVDSNGKLMRSTSSERYKEILSNVVLTDEMYNKAINEIQPIVYRSTADADNSKYHYYSFSAEKVGAFDPALALWLETETVTDEDGNTTERKLDERVAEGLNINGILALQYAMIVYQHGKQVELESRIDALEQAKG